MVPSTGAVFGDGFEVAACDAPEFRADPGMQLIVPVLALPYCTNPVLVVGEWGAEIGR